MRALIQVKRNDPAYNKAFKHGAIFALFLHGTCGLMYHDAINAAVAFAMAVVCAVCL